MTTIEFFKKELDKAKINYRRAILKSESSIETLNLQEKIRFYKEAVEALEEKDNGR